MLDDEVVIRLLDHGTVRSADGRALGRVGQLFRSDSDGEATWVSIDAGGVDDGPQTLVPMAGARVDGNDLQVAYPADAVVGAPQVAVGAPVSGDDERRVREFYAMDGAAHAPTRDRAGYRSMDDESMDDEALDDVAVHRTSAARDAAPDADRTAADVARPADDDAPIDGPAVADVLAPDAVAPDEQAREDGARENGAREDPVPDDLMRHDATRDDGAPATDILSVVRSEEQLVVGTQWVPVRRARLEKFQVTETRTIEVEWTREDVRVVYEPLEEGAAAEPSPAADPRPWVLMEERIVVTKEWVPAQSVRLVVDRVTGEQIVSEPVRKEQVELQQVDPAGPSSD